MNFIVRWYRRKKMKKIVEIILKLITAGPLAGYRTKILSAIMIGLTVGKAMGWLDTVITNDQYATLMGLLAPAAAVTAAAHKN